MDREVRAYLAGGIHTNPETGENEDVYRVAGAGWRAAAAIDLAAVGIKSHNPAAKPVGFSHGVNEIVDLDIFEIERSTFLLAELMDGAYPYIGTIMELVYAKRLRKPTIVFANEYRGWHPWVKYHATRVFASYDEAVDYAQNRFGLWVRGGKK